MSIKTVIIAAASFMGGLAIGHMLGKRRNKKVDEEMREAYENACDFNMESRKELVRLRKEKEAREREERALAEAAAMYPEDDIAPEEERDPIEITEQQMNEEFEESAFDQLTYYRGDHQLVDSGNEIIGNAEYLIGKAVNDVLPTTDRGMIFVHNFAMDTNFEIAISYEASPFGAIDFDDLDDYSI